MPPHQAPSTPQRRRREKAPPETPALKSDSLIADTLQANGLTVFPKPRSQAVNRLADPNRTNAPLFSPETSRIVAPKTLDAVSPSKLPRVKTTTDNILEIACAHLVKVDERMRPLIDKHHCRVFSPEGLAEEVDPFESLVSSIM